MNRLTIALVSSITWFLSGPADAAEPPAKPMRVVMQISENQPAIWNMALNNIRNVQKEVGAKNIEVEVVVYGPGLAMLHDDATTANRVQEAMATGVRFVACRNTMQSEHITEAELIPGISFAQAGVVEIINKQMAGYAYLRP